MKQTMKQSAIFSVTAIALSLTLCLNGMASDFLGLEGGGQLGGSTLGLSSQEERLGDSEITPLAGEAAAVVTTYEELTKALSEDNGVTTVYLGADITATAVGAVINSAKEAVVIDGRDPETGTIHTFTQVTGNSIDRVLRVEGSASKVKSITLQNLIINGKNSFGMAAVADSARDVAIVHSNVDYTGPQAVYNRNGSVELRDSRYSLQTAGGVATNELAEVVHAAFAGKVTVKVPSSGNGILWLTAAGSTLTFREEAVVDIEAGYYFVYTGGQAPTVTLERNASLTLVNKRGFTYDDQRISTFLLEEGSSLVVEQNTTSSFAAIRVSKLFEMRPGSSATVVRTGTDGIPLRLTNAGARAVFDRPARVFLYSSAGVPLRFTGEGTLSITASALNAWSKTAWPPADTGKPDHIWNKAGHQSLEVAGTYNEAENRGLTHNLTGEDPVVTALSAANFNLEKSQLVAFGEMALTPDLPVVYTDKALTGQTEANAYVEAWYDTQAGPSTAAGAAAGDGGYSLSVPDGPLVPDSVAIVTAVADRLAMRQQAPVQGSGSLSFAAIPDRVVFGTVEIPGEPVLVPRGEGSMELVVSDLRARPGSWRLDASLVTPLHGVVGEEISSLGNAIVFVGEDGTEQALSETPLPVYRHSGEGGDVTLAWDPEQGILLRVSPGELYSDVGYTATIAWDLVDAP